MASRLSPTKIEWCTHVWNPWTGCNHVSEACDRCYARSVAKRFWGGRAFENVQFHEDRLDQPLRTKKPARVFVCSMSDFFHPAADRFRARAMHVMEKADWHTYYILTKRIERVKDLPSFNTSQASWWGKVWFGVTVENQKRADQRIPLLLDLHEERNFISVEPMLGPLDLSGHGSCHCPRAKGQLGWVICGAETGPGKRWMDASWAYDLKKQCDAAGVPFFFKKDYLGGFREDWREIP